ncbi:hypothetical protein CRG98_036824 [Punica granatum]|uniref:PGG domain-containing protein n=2 Tax=Punica granatum TaxID=22663 RepID=A0A2I0IFM0_PUNGR|nr:hypothetical protein CRG98_036824 [Punica granatum]
MYLDPFRVLLLVSSFSFCIFWEGEKQRVALQGHDEQTVVHIAVEANNFESFEVLLGWILTIDRENLLYWKDMDGNTVLHVATRTNQIQVVKRLLQHIDDAVKNFMGETALEMHDNDNGQHRNAEVGRALRAARSGNPLFPLFWKEWSLAGRNLRLAEYLRHDLSEIKLWKRRIKRSLDNMGVRFAKSQELVIVVAILVATATYQGILSPPGGFWQDSTDTGPATSVASDSTLAPHLAGQMVMNDKLLYTYIGLNSYAFSTSVCLIIAHMPADVLFGGYLMITMTILLDTYLFALSSTLPPNHIILKVWMHMVIVEASFLGPLIVIARIWIMAARKFMTFKLDAAEIGHKGQVVEYDEDKNARSNQHGS